LDTLFLRREIPQRYEMKYRNVRNSELSTLLTRGILTTDGCRWKFLKLYR